MDHALSLETLGITSNCTVSLLSRLRVGLVRTCLGSGRVQIASRSVAGQCEPNATGVVHLVMLALLFGMTKKGKVPRAPWVVLLCRPRPALGRMLCRFAVPRPRLGVGSALLPLLKMSTKSTEDMVKALKLLQDVMTKEDFSRYEKMVMPPSSQTGGKGEAS